MARRAPALVLMATLAAGIVSGCKSSNADPRPAPAASGAPIASTAPAAPDASVPLHYEATGVAQPWRTSLLASKGSGILRTIKVREGDRVKANDVLCVLDTVEISIQAEGAAVAHRQAMTALENAKADYDRAMSLFDAGALPDQTREKAEMALRLARLQTEAASVSVRLARQQLANATLRAPFSGVITRVLAEEGQLITTMPPAPIFQIADTDTLEVRLKIPERRVAHMRVGIPVVVELPAMNARREAKVDRVSEVVDPMTRSAEIIVLLDNKDHALPGGLFARVTFPTVPAEAHDGSGEGMTEGPALTEQGR